MQYFRFLILCSTWALCALSLCARPLCEEDTLTLSTPEAPPVEKSPPLCVQELGGDSLSDYVLPLPHFVSPLPWQMSAPGLDGIYPYWGGPAGWSDTLHKGLNAQLSMSLTAAFGRGAPSGVGFSQHAAFAYATPLGRRASLAVGLFAQNMDWGRFHHTDVGVSAILGFQATERLNLYGYATHSFLPLKWKMPYPGRPYFLDDFSTRIGGMAEFKIGENAFIQVGVEHRR